MSSFLENCAEAPEVVCNCEGKVCTCKIHFNAHITLAGFSHSIRAMLSGSDLELKNQSIENLKAKWQELEELSNLIKKDIRSQIEQLEIQLENSLEKIDKEKKEIFDLMVEIISTERTPKHELNNTQAIKASETKISDNLIREKPQTIKAAETKILDNLIREKPRECLDIDWIWLFKEQSKTLKTINLISLSESQKEIKFSKLISSKISMCVLPNKKVFCYGNYEKQANRYSGITFTIDDRNQNNIQMLTQGIPCRSSGLVYYDEAVYSFGGLCNISLNLCQKYNLKENKWEQLEPLEKPVSCCSCDILGNNIVYSGIETGINTYAINLNLHSLVFPLQNNFSKIVFCTGERIIVAENGGKMYESGALDTSSWSCIGNSQTPDLEPVGYKAFYKNSIAFALLGSKLPIFQFSKDTKKINYLQISKSKKKQKDRKKNKTKNSEENKKQNKEQINKENKAKTNKESKKQNKQQINEENKKQGKQQIKEKNNKQEKQQINKKNNKQGKQQINEENKKQGKQQTNEENKQINGENKKQDKQQIYEENKKQNISKNKQEAKEPIKWKKVEVLENTQNEKETSKDPGQNKNSQKDPQENKLGTQNSQEEIKSNVSESCASSLINLKQSETPPNVKENEEYSKIKIPAQQNKENLEDTKLQKKKRNEENKEKSSSSYKLYIFAEGSVEEYTKEALNLFEKEGATEVILSACDMAIPSLIQVVEEIKASQECLYQINEFFNLSDSAISEDNCDAIEDKIEVAINLSKVPINSAHYGYQHPIKMTAPLIINAEPFSSSEDSFNSAPNENQTIEAPLIISSEPLPSLEIISPNFIEAQDYQDGMELMDFNNFFETDW